MTANILTPRERHEQDCHTPRLVAGPHARVGDVRRCPHGYLQLAYTVPGTIPPYWRDLSPVFNPILYRRASHALR